MPDPGLFPPVQQPLDPNLYPQYIDTMRKQQLAQLLMGTAQQSAQTPAEWNSMRVVPKRSPLANVATLASALMAGKALGSANEGSQNYYQKLMGMAPSAPNSAPNPAPSAPQEAPPEPPPLIRNPGYVSPPPAAPQPSQPAQPQAAQPSSMLLPGTDMATSQRLFTLLGPQKYGEVLAAQYQPTEMEKMLRAAGVTDPAITGPILQATVAKANYVPPIEQRVNSIERAPFSNAVIGVNPATPTGGVNFYDPAGRFTGQGLAPGAASTIEASERAAQLGKTAGQYSVLPTAGGGSAVVGGPQGVAPTAPPPGGLQAPRVGQPAGTQSQAATPASDPWASMPKLPISTAIGAPDEFTKGVLQEAGKKHAELSNKYGAEADLADQKQQYNAQAIAQLPLSETGPLSSWLTEHRAALIEAGMPASLVPSSGTIVPTLELNKYLKNAALQGARQIYGSRMTQMEVKLQTDEMSPSSSMMRDAIASLIQQDNIRNGYSKQRSEDYGRFMENKGNPLRFESWYAKHFPLTGYAKANTPSGPAPGSAPAPAEVARVRQNFTPQEIQAEMERRRKGGG